MSSKSLGPTDLSDWKKKIEEWKAVEEERSREMFSQPIGPKIRCTNCPDPTADELSPMFQPSVLPLRAVDKKALTKKALTSAIL